MLEGETPQEPRSVAKEVKPTLTRREFLKKLGWEVVKYGSLAAVGKFFYELHKYIFGDIAVLIRCLTSETSDFQNIQAEILKDNYDEALLVVHPGYGLLRRPDRFSEKEGYKDYLTRLKKVIEESRKNEDLVVFLVGAREMKIGSSVEGLKFSDADFAVITSSDSPLPIACVETPGGKLFYQKINTPRALHEFLMEKGVKKVNLAGEFKSTCVTLAKNFLDAGGLQVEVLKDAVYSSSMEPKK